MKSTRIIAFALLMSAAAFTACKRVTPDEAPLDGVWEGPMTITDGETSVKVLTIEGDNAEFADYIYTL